MSGVQHAAKQAPRLRGSTIIPDLPRKLAQRSTQAQRQAARDRARAAESTRRALKRDNLGNAFRVRRAQLNNLYNERRWRREDRELGILAPKRDVGDKADTFGASSLVDMAEVRVKRSQMKDWGIVEGDRVVVIKPGHKDRGRISKVKTVKIETQEVTVEECNVSDLAIPDHILVKEADKTPVRPYEMPMQLKDVRLVAPIPDPATGAIRDVVIQELMLQKLTRREKAGLDPPTRTIAGLTPPVLIPYPEKAAEEEVAEEYGIDTLRIEVENRTWTPTLHMPPMPPGVLDELRNKFSAFRFRHDDEYIAAKTREELRKKGVLRYKADLMLTPIKQARRLERMQRKALGRPELTEEELAKIGEIMEKNLNTRAELIEQELRDIPEGATAEGP